MASGVQPQDGAVMVCSRRLGVPSWQGCLSFINTGSEVAVQVLWGFFCCCLGVFCGMFFHWLYKLDGVFAN